MSDEVVTYPQNTRRAAGYNAADEVQSLAQATGTSTAGTFKLTVALADGSSKQTAAIAYNASAATVQSAVEALDNVPTGSIVASGGALPGTPVVLTFTDSFRNTNEPAITVDNTSNTGGTYAITTTTQGGAATDVQIAANNGNVDARSSSGLVSQHRADAAPTISSH